MDNDNILVENPIVDHNSHINNESVANGDVQGVESTFFQRRLLHTSLVNDQQVENSIQNQSISVETVKVFHKVKKTSMNPTPLEYSYWSTYPVGRVLGLFVLLTNIVVLIGAFIICFTSPKAKIENCQLKFTTTTTIEYNSSPRSVAVGHFNNDTFLDFVVANKIVNEISIYFSYDNGTFANPKSYPTGNDSSPFMIAVSDFNNDLRLDIAVANFGTNSIGIFIGIENGSFADQIVISTGSSHPRWIHITDFNNDTFFDIITANYGTDSISILFGYGNGSFQTPITYSTGYDSLPYSVVTGDFNNDNQLDIAVANYGTNNIGVFFGNDNGTLTNQIIFSTGSHSHPSSIAIGDLNNDLYIDMVVTDKKNNNILIFFGYGNGSFLSPKTFRIDIISQSYDVKMFYIGYSSLLSFIIVDDFNNDKNLDFAVINEYTNSLTVHLQTC